MVAHRLSKWFRRSARQANPTKTAREPRRRRRLSLECLEDRVVPTVTTIDFGGLRFFDAAGFTKNETTGDDEAILGRVSIGYTPANNEAFQVLLIANIDQGNSGETFTLSTATNPTQPHFTLTDGQLELQAGVASPGLPIPITGPVATFTADIT